MRKISYLLLAGLIMLAACKPSFKKADGMEYAIVNSGKGDLLKQGEFLEMHFTNLLSRKGKKDSLLNNTREMGAPQFMQFDSINIPPAYLKIFKQMRVGDSVSTRILVDSMFKDNPMQMPPFMKKGDMIYTNIKIVNAHKTQEAADSARKASTVNAEKVAKEKAAALIKADDKAIADYLAKNKIKAERSDKGVYVETTTPGTGAFLDTNSIVRVKYTGKTLAGVMFDSNVDPSKGHTDPLTVNLTNDKSIGNGVIPGLESGMFKLQKGSKAKVYIPSGLAYGTRGGGPDLPPNANLVFDIEVLDIITKEQLKADNAAAAAKAKAEQDAQQKLMQQQQKVYEDSLQKADPKKFEEYKQQMQQQMMQQMQQQGQGRPQR
jgi:FKBP-type peptidyl-prolyl cis-trans isomerase FkpA